MIKFDLYLQYKTRLQRKYKIKTMKPAYNRSKIMRNAWYMFRVKMVKNFAEALRKAWKNEKLANIRAMIEGRPQPASEPTPYNIPTGSNPAFAAGCIAYYGDASRYYGD